MRHLIPINSALGVLVFFVGFALFANIMVSLRMYILYHRSIDILVCAYDWLEKARLREEQDVAHHEGTD